MFDGGRARAADDFVENGAPSPCSCRWRSSVGRRSEKRLSGFSLAPLFGLWVAPVGTYWQGWWPSPRNPLSKSSPEQGVLKVELHSSSNRRVVREPVYAASPNLTVDVGAQRPDRALPAPSRPGDLDAGPPRLYPVGSHDGGSRPSRFGRNPQASARAYHLVPMLTLSESVERRLQRRGRLLAGGTMNRSKSSWKEFMAGSSSSG